MTDHSLRGWNALELNGISAAVTRYLSSQTAKVYRPLAPPKAAGGTGGSRQPFPNGFQCRQAAFREERSLGNGKESNRRPPAPKNKHGTITLTSGELLISDSVTVHCPGTNQLSINGNSSSRVVEISIGTASIDHLAIPTARGAPDAVRRRPSAGIGGPSRCPFRLDRPMPRRQRSKRCSPPGRW
jgi:hypothetical protein